MQNVTILLAATPADLASQGSMSEMQPPAVSQAVSLYRERNGGYMIFTSILFSAF